MALRYIGGSSFRISSRYYCTVNKKGTIINEFKTTNWTKERQQACVDTLLKTKNDLQEKWRENEEIAGGDEETMEQVKLNEDTGEIGGPRGPEPTR